MFLCFELTVLCNKSTQKKLNYKVKEQNILSNHYFPLSNSKASKYKRNENKLLRHNGEWNK